MPTSIYQCPTTGLLAQGWFADSGGEGRTETYEGLTCLACRQIHFTNQHTGDMMGRGPRYTEAEAVLMLPDMIDHRFPPTPSS